MIFRKYTDAAHNAWIDEVDIPQYDALPQSSKDIVLVVLRVLGWQPA